MKRLILGVAAALMLSTGHAAADGMPTKGGVRAPAVAAGPSWNGFYVGAGIGAGAVVHDIGGFFDGIGGEGVFGTVSVGYDRMLWPGWVGGVFTDYDFSGISTEIGPISADHDYSWSVGARLGALVNPTTLLYGTAGYTQAEFSLDTPGGSESQTFGGYFLGGGIETFLHKDWTLKLEYRFSQFDQELDLIEPSMHTVRVGVSYRFGHRD